MGSSRRHGRLCSTWPIASSFVNGKVEKKERNPLSWVKSRKALCGLVMESKHLDELFKVGDKWLVAGGETVSLLLAGGSVTAERLFSGTAAQMLEAKVADKMKAGLEKLKTMKPTTGELITQAMLNTIIQQTLDDCATIAGAFFG